MEFMPGDLQAYPSPPSTADSFGCIGLSGFSDDSGEDRSYSPELTGVSENWPDSASETSALVVTVEGDGSQLIHIPCESPFYFSPSIQTHSFGFPLSPSGPTPYSPFTPCLSISSSSSSSSSSSRSSTILSATPKDDQSQYHGTPFLFINQTLEDHGSTQPSQKGSRGAMLFVDTNFLSPSSTNIAFPALPTAASRYLSGGTHTGYGSSSSPWGSERNYDGDLDVPRSAITPVSPMDFWDEVCLRMVIQ
ncbi:hypothetical protein DFP72DRAFT_32707 [Ephemerocybe angulata]|uniref:Uncharacterized protein n=1 Tax=Ephemerocybe angulata TaxID=980116 RepID=A0A8H6IBC1_9AGAR|nr:hypothetical protein DFP72DRAFT_32707 [Tulosesus angulatus]